MKANKYVYILKNSNNVVIDVGESIEPYRRLIRKTKHADSKFSHEENVTIEIVAGPMIRPKALELEYKLKDKYNLYQSEKESRKAGQFAKKISQRKLTIKDAKDIRKKYVKGVYGYKLLAKEYGVYPRVIQLIIANKTYTEK